MPLISVIVPVYKVQDYLNRCVESILKQTYKDFELILVDDGSPDKCPLMCDEWAKRDSRISVIHQKNQGLSAARNAGIRIASGQYFTFVDSDDWISSTMIQDLLDLLKKHDADISICNFLSTDHMVIEKSNLRNKETVYSQEEFMKVIMRINGNRCIHYAWGKLYKRSVIDLDAHYPVGMLNEDVEGMFKAVIASSKIVETTKIGYYYFENMDSISRKKFGNNFLCLHEVWKRVLMLSEKKAPKYYEYVKYNYQRSDFTILMDLILYGDKSSDEKYKKEQRIVLTRLRGNLCDLLKSSMRIDRKAMLICVAFSYPLFKVLVRSVYRFRKK